MSSCGARPSAISGSWARAAPSTRSSTIYAKEKDIETKKAIIQAFFNQNNAEQLVAIARKETDPQCARRSSAACRHMRSKVALDYLMEILNK